MHYRNLKKIAYNGKLLTHAGNGYQKGNVVSQFFVEKLDERESTPDHYYVYWNIEEFLKQYDGGMYNWQYPPHIYKINDKEKQKDLLEYAKKCRPLNKTVYSKENKALKIINTPLENSLIIGEVIYKAIAVDDEKNVYEVFWNMLNIIKPEKIELTVVNIVKNV